MPDPNGAREFAGIQGPVIDGHPVRAMVYESPAQFPGYEPSFYFCCQTCGACGKHWNDADYAITQAALYMFNFDHKSYLEDHDDSPDRRPDSGSPPAILPPANGSGTGDDSGASA